MNEKESLHTRYPDLLPYDEAVDPACARLIDELETVYAAVKRPANLSEQLVSTLQNHLEQADPAAALPAASFPDPPTPMRLPRERHRRGWQRLSTLATVLFAALLASSFILLLFYAHQTCTGRVKSQTTPATWKLIQPMTYIHMLNARIS